MGGLRFLIGSRDGSGAAQSRFTGQAVHFGCRAVQTFAPRSISAELYAAALRFGNNALAEDHRALRPAAASIEIVRFCMRARTRAMFASTIGTDRSKAN